MHLRYNLTRALSTANSNGLIIVGVLSALLFGLVALAQAWYTTEVLVESSWLLAPSMWYEHLLIPPLRPSHNMCEPLTMNIDDSFRTSNGVFSWKLKAVPATYDPITGESDINQSASAQRYTNQSLSACDIFGMTVAVDIRRGQVLMTALIRCEPSVLPIMMETSATASIAAADSTLIDGVKLDEQTWSPVGHPATQQINWALQWIGVALVSQAQKVFEQDASERHPIYTSVYIESQPCYTAACAQERSWPILQFGGETTVFNNGNWTPLGPGELDRSWSYSSDFERRVDNLVAVFWSAVRADIGHMGDFNVFGTNASSNLAEHLAPPTDSITDPVYQLIHKTVDDYDQLPIRSDEVQSWLDPTIAGPFLCRMPKKRSWFDLLYSAAVNFFALWIPFWRAAKEGASALARYRNKEADFCEGHEEAEDEEKQGYTRPHLPYSGKKPSASTSTATPPHSPGPPQYVPKASPAETVTVPKPSRESTWTSMANRRPTFQRASSSSYFGVRASVPVPPKSSPQPDEYERRAHRASEPVAASRSTPKYGSGAGTPERTSSAQRSAEQY